MRLKIYSMFLLFLSLPFFVSAQETTEKIDAEVTEIKETTKIAEFDGIPDEEFLPKLKKFNDFLEKNKDAQGYVIYYSGFDEPLFRQTTYYIRRKTEKIDNYLFRCFGNFRITFIIGGSREKRTTELWLVPNGKEKPEPTADTEIQRELLYKFELLETDKLEFEAVETKTPNADNPEVNFQIKNKFDLEDLLNVAGKVLSKDEYRRSVLIFYLDDSKGNVQKYREIIEQFVEENAEKNNLDLRRVKIIYGGYRRQFEVESWAIPIDEMEPEAMPDEKID